ncbi:glycosyltransferase family 2 protein [Candidatus Uhrbacteria bacterium]|nr:glycosyltransferase family 2 protein [Candidatus Uhrbacteria bacterium]
MKSHSVVISLVVYNGEPYLKKCLESIHAQIYTDYSLVIVDNASIDNSRELIRQYGARATVIFQNENIGFSRAHNHVIRASNSDFIFILNQDCVLSPDYIERCVAVLKEGDMRASVTGSLVRIDRLTNLSGNGMIDTLGLCIHRTFHIANIGSGLPIERIPKRPFQVFGVSATAALYRRKSLADVAHHATQEEYFDEDFFMYKEDVDLAFRLHHGGFSSWCEPRARGYHVRSTESRLFVRANPFINTRSYQNHLLFLMKNMTWPLMWRYGLFIVLYEIAKICYLAVWEPSTLQTLSSAWKLRHKMKRKRPHNARYAHPLSFGCKAFPHAN